MRATSSAFASCLSVATLLCVFGGREGGEGLHAKGLWTHVLRQHVLSLKHHAMSLVYARTYGSEQESVQMGGT